MKVPGKKIYIQTRVNVEKIMGIDFRPGEELHFKRDFLKYVFKKNNKTISLNVSYASCGNIDEALECLRNLSDKLYDAMVKKSIKEITQRKNSYTSFIIKVENGKVFEVTYRRFNKLWEVIVDDEGRQEYENVDLIGLIEKLETN